MQNMSDKRMFFCFHNKIPYQNIIRISYLYSLCISDWLQFDGIVVSIICHFVSFKSSSEKNLTFACHRFIYLSACGLQPANRNNKAKIKPLWVNRGAGALHSLYRAKECTVSADVWSINGAIKTAMWLVLNSYSVCKKMVVTVVVAVIVL